MPDYPSCRDQIREIDPTRTHDWDERLSGWEGATIFHSAAWLRVLADTYGFTPKCLSYAGAHCTAFLPVMQVSSWLTGKRGISLPFTDECGALCNEARVFSDLHVKIAEIAANCGWRTWEYRSGGKFFPAATPSLSFYGHTLNLRNHRAAEADGAIAAATRKAERSGVSVEFSKGLQSLGVFYTLLCETRKRHGIPPQPFSFFRNIQKQLLSSDWGTVALAKANGKTIAGAVFFHFKRNVIYKFAASDRKFKSMSGNTMILWHAIQKYRTLGFHDMEFGRTSIHNEGLRRFKLSWGTQERLIDYLEYNFLKQSFVRKTDVSSGPHNRIFRLLPLALSNIVGRLGYRHVA